MTRIGLPCVAGNAELDLAIAAVRRALVSLRAAVARKFALAYWMAGANLGVNLALLLCLVG
jgi:hypothetical protein